jgi:hypothetical protein
MGKGNASLTCAASSVRRRGLDGVFEPDAIARTAFRGRPAAAGTDDVHGTRSKPASRLGIAERPKVQPTPVANALRRRMVDDVAVGGREGSGFFVVKKPPALHDAAVCQHPKLVAFRFPVLGYDAGHRAVLPQQDRLLHRDLKPTGIRRGLPYDESPMRLHVVLEPIRQQRNSADTETPLDE